MVVSFANETIVLLIGDDVEEVTDSGFFAETSTINVGQLGNDSLIQVYSKYLKYPFDLLRFFQTVCAILK